MPRSRSYGFAFYPRDWNRRFDSAPRRISVRRRRSARGGPPEPPADLCGCGQSVSLRLVPLTGLRLATRADSPARVSRRNPRARSGRIAVSLPFRLLQPSVLSALGACRQPFSGAFHNPSGFLFTFRSDYCCAIGLGEYLGLAELRCRLRVETPVRATLVPVSLG